MKKTILVLLICATVLGTCFATGEQEATGESVKNYVFATNATWPPFEYIDDAGNMTGYEIELVQKIADIEEINIVIKNVAFDSIFAGLANGGFDGAAAGITVTEERAEVVDFCDAFANVGQVFIVKNKDASSIKNVDDLKDMKVGVQLGTTGDFALDDSGVVKMQYNNIGLAIEDMLNGNLVACVCDSLIASNFVLENENYKELLSITGEPFTKELIAICVSKGNTELLDMINAGQKKLEENGELAKLKAKYNIL